MIIMIDLFTGPERCFLVLKLSLLSTEKVKQSNYQELAQSERKSHSKNRGWEQMSGTSTTRTYHKQSEQLFPNWWPLI